VNFLDITKKLISRFRSNDPFLIAQELNIEVRFADLGASTRGLYVRKLRRRCIFIHERLDEYWQRFVCAHELGHDRLHPGFSRFWLDEHTFFNPGKFERQANQFAVHLLLGGALPTEDQTVQDLFSSYGIPKEMLEFY
jgi:Zn-dependent peptidase ImmA (M78 family)